MSSNEREAPSRRRISLIFSSLPFVVGHPANNNLTFSYPAHLARSILPHITSAARWRKLFSWASQAPSAFWRRWRGAFTRRRTQRTTDEHSRQGHSDHPELGPTPRRCRRTARRTELSRLVLAIRCFLLRWAGVKLVAAILLRPQGSPHCGALQPRVQDCQAPPATRGPAGPIRGAHRAVSPVSVSLRSRSTLVTSASSC